MKATTAAGKGQFGLVDDHGRASEHGRRDGELGDRLGRRLAEGRQVQLHRSRGGEGRSTTGAQSVAYAPKGTNSATARQLFIDGKVAFLRDGPWVWGAVEKAPAEVRPNLKMARLAVPRRAGRASNSLHIAAKTDAKKKDAAWNFIQMAASPEWQRALRR